MLKVLSLNGLDTTHLKAWKPTQLASLLSAVKEVDKSLLKNFNKLSKEDWGVMLELWSLPNIPAGDRKMLFTNIGKLLNNMSMTQISEVIVKIYTTPELYKDRETTLPEISELDYSETLSVLNPSAEEAEQTVEEGVAEAEQMVEEGVAEAEQMAEDVVEEAEEGEQEFEELAEEGEQELDQEVEQLTTGIDNLRVQTPRPVGSEVNLEFFTNMLDNSGLSHTGDEFQLTTEDGDEITNYVVAENEFQNGLIVFVLDDPAIFPVTVRVEKLSTEIVNSFINQLVETLEISNEANFIVSTTSVNRVIVLTMTEI